MITISLVSGTFPGIARCDTLLMEHSLVSSKCSQEKVIAVVPTQLKHNQRKSTELESHSFLRGGISYFAFDLFDGQPFGNFQGNFQINEETGKSKAEKLKEYDDLFDKEAKERDEYYGKMALEKIRREQQQTLQEDERQTMATAITSTKGDNTLEDLENSLSNVQEEIVRLQIDLSKSRSSGKVGVDAENDENNGEQAYMAMRLRKAEEEKKILQKNINLERSLQVIRQQRQYDENLIQRRANQREQEKQLAIEKIRNLKDEENEKFRSMLNQKRAEVKELKFARDQSSFEQKLDAIDFYATRKGLVQSPDDANVALEIDQ